MAVEHDDPVSKRRYEDKIARIKVDPYKIKADDWDQNPSRYPPIAYGDIFNYLVLQTST